MYVEIIIPYSGKAPEFSPFKRLLENRTKSFASTRFWGRGKKQMADVLDYVFSHNLSKGIGGTISLQNKFTKS